MKSSLIARVVAKPGQRPELEKVLSRIIDECRTEEGTEMYIMNVSKDNPDEIWFYELYSSPDAFQAHLAHRDTMVALNAEQEPFIASVQLIETTPIEGIGITLA